MGLAAPYLSVLCNALNNIHSLPKKDFAVALKLSK